MFLKTTGLDEITNGMNTEKGPSLISEIFPREEARERKNQKRNLRSEQTRKKEGHRKALEVKCIRKCIKQEEIFRGAKYC